MNSGQPNLLGDAVNESNAYSRDDPVVGLSRHSVFAECDETELRERLLSKILNWRFRSHAVIWPPKYSA
jgi:hypothetical protein